MSMIFRSSEPWITINLTTIHRAAPGPGELASIAVGGTPIWTPPTEGYFRGFVCNDDSGDPLAPLGGATQLLAGVTLAAVMVNATAIASFNVARGAGISGPSVATGIIGNPDPGVVVYPAGSLPGRAAAAQLVVLFSNAGTLNGTVHSHFDFLPKEWV